MRADLADETPRGILERMRAAPRALARAVGRDPKDGTVGHALKVLEEAGRAVQSGGGWRRVPGANP